MVRTKIEKWVVHTLIIKVVFYKEYTHSISFRLGIDSDLDKR